MIKKLLSAALVLGFISVNAQQIKVANSPKAATFTPSSTLRLGAGNQVMNVIDTLMPSILTNTCATQPGGLVYYSWDFVTPNDSGYCFGTGIFPFAGANTTEVAQKYPSGTVGLSVTDVLVVAAVASGTSATTTAKIYAENVTTKAPSTVLGTSAAIPMSSYTVGAFTKYTFGTAVAVGANVNFYAAITIPPFGGTDLDTLAVTSTQFGCSTVDSLSWSLVSPYGWFNHKGLFGANLDLLIFPVVDIPTTSISGYTKGNMSLFAASPNPTSNSVNINFSLNNASKVEIEILDITGKVVKTIKDANIMLAGKHSVSVDVSSLESGSYMYSVNAGGNKLFSKFVVTK